MENKQTSNRTEVEPTGEEVATKKFQHLAPALHAGDAQVGKEDMVVAIVPKAFNITLSDGTRQRVAFTPGSYEIPARFKEHFYVQANGVTFPAEKKVQKPQTEKALDQSLLTEDYLEGVDKMDALKSIFAQIGGDQDLIKGNTSKADIRVMILDQVKANASK